MVLYKCNFLVGESEKNIEALIALCFVAVVVRPTSHHPGKQLSDFVSSHQMLCSYLNKTET